MKPGDWVTASIRLQRPLGRGGMGRVWLAQHDGLQCEVVVKFILDDQSRTDEVRARFEREASLLALVRSPHVVQVYDYGIALSGQPYIAMEYLEGEDLGSYLSREGRVQPAVFCDWFSQICQGLGRAHARGTVHRDLKPANLFLAQDDDGIVVKILDFGVAMNLFDAEEDGVLASPSVRGTMAYMSPEQARGTEEVDARSDLWSLGVVAYRGLTGTLPFRGASADALARSILHHQFTPPSQVVPDLPEALDAWMQRALTRDPEARYSTARGMADALRQVLGRGPSTEPTQGDAFVSDLATGQSAADQLALRKAGLSESALGEPAVSEPGVSKLGVSERGASKLGVSELEMGELGFVQRGSLSGPASSSGEESPFWTARTRMLAFVALFGLASASYAAVRLWVE